MEVKMSSFSERLISHLSDIGVRYAFGVMGGAIAHFYGSLVKSEITSYHCRHETSAAFAAIESYFACNKPALVYTTTGPGFLNALTGIASGKSEGAKLVVISGTTNTSLRGRFAAQETSCYHNNIGFENRNSLIDFSIRIDAIEELPQVIHRIRIGFQRPEGFITHLALSLNIQKAMMDCSRNIYSSTYYPAASSSSAIDVAAELISKKSCIVAVGYGARSAHKEVTELIDKRQLKIFSTPRGKGIVDEYHPHYLGCSGVGGSELIAEHFKENRPEVLLVLGSRLGEGSTYWDETLLPSEQIIQVDIDPSWIGCAYPEQKTSGIQSDIKNFLQLLLPNLSRVECLPADKQKSVISRLDPISNLDVRPAYLMQCIQCQIIDSTDAIIMSEVGNAFAWSSYFLKFNHSNRYRVSPGFGAMGHFCAGALGAALATKRKVVAIVGDGSMLMNCEINTAVQYQAPVVWIVLNDSSYDTCEKGMRYLGFEDVDFSLPAIDFVQVAEGKGAIGLSITSEFVAERILKQAMQSIDPVVVDVRINKNEISPLFKRFENLARQSRPDHISGWSK